MTLMTVRISIDGASAEELERGAKAAEAFFRSQSVAPASCAQAAFAREGWDIRGFEGSGPPDEVMRLADIWDHADLVALEASCRDWLHKPHTANLELS
jgi:hypothetical protein